MRRLTWIFALAAAASLTSSVLAQAQDAPRNDLPQPYRTTRDWGQLPPGVKWAAVTAIEPAPDGTIYVVHRCFANSCAGRSEAPILKYDASGTLLKSWGEGMFIFPHGATVDRDGNLWLTDAGGANGKGHQVFKFSPEGKVLMTLGKAGVSGSGPDVFDQPTDVLIAPNGNIFVTDSHRNGKNNRVVKFTKDGTFLKEWGKKGSGPGELSEPHTIAMDSRGRLFVGDRENNRIQIFDQDGGYIAQWRQFGRPSGIAIAKDDTLYVADSESGPDTGAHELTGIKKGIRIGSAKDGKVAAYIEDMESTTADHSGAEGVGVDAQGNVYGAVVRRQMLERHVIGQAFPARPGGARPARLTQPRVAPLSEAQWTDLHRQLVAKYVPDGRAGNGLKTLLNIPELVDGMMPFQNYITKDSSLSPRHREMLILRTGWLLGNEYVWAGHAAIARNAGLSAGELRRIAQGPDANGWDPFEAALLRLADQLFRNCSVDDATWKALSASYDMYHLMDAVMTVTDFTTVSLMYNSLGVQPDEGVTDRMPTDIPYGVVAPEREPPLAVARVEPGQGPGIAIGRTFARYPKLAAARSTGSNYVNQRSKLDPRYREMLILRTGWDCQAEYEWAQHVGNVGRAREKGLDPLKLAEGPNASGWDAFDVVILNAADELYRDSFVSDRTWNALAARFDTTTIINALITASNYRMVSMALNAFGVQIDPGDERFPTLPAR